MECNTNGKYFLVADYVMCVYTYICIYICYFHIDMYSTNRAISVLRYYNNIRLVQFQTFFLTGTCAENNIAIFSVLVWIENDVYYTFSHLDPSTGGIGLPSLPFGC